MENKVKPFVLLSNQRSGSTFVRIWLNSHSKISCYGEIFLGHYKSPDGLKQFCEKRYLDKFIHKIHYLPIIRKAKVNFINRKTIDSFLNSMFYDPLFPAPWTDINDRNNCPVKSEKTMIGFKLMVNTLNSNSNISDWLIDHKPRMIYLKRQNLLKRYISEARMVISKIDHSTSDIKIQPLLLNLDHFRQYIKDAEVEFEGIKKTYSRLNSYLEISYEDFFNRNNDVKFKILNFLGQDIEKMAFPGLKKISSQDIDKEIINANEVVNYLQKTQYSWFLYEFGIKN